MDDEIKLQRLLEHWIGHSQDHERTYRDWGERMQRSGHSGVADALLDAAERERGMKSVFRLALERLQARSEDPAAGHEQRGGV